ADPLFEQRLPAPRLLVPFSQPDPHQTTMKKRATTEYTEYTEKRQKKTTRKEGRRQAAQPCPLISLPVFVDFVSVFFRVFRVFRGCPLLALVCEEVDVAEVDVGQGDGVADVAGRAVHAVLCQAIAQHLHAGRELRPAAAQDREHALLEDEVHR